MAQPPPDSSAPAAPPAWIDVMVDIEMMGEGPRAAIASIAACRFERLGPPPSFDAVRQDGFDQAVSVQSCLNAGLTVSGKTIAWWLAQSEPARQALLAGPLPLREALSGLRKVLAPDGDHRFTRVWAKPAAGDLVVLHAAYDAVGALEPWLGKNRRCLSSFKAELAGPWPSDAQAGGLKHVALYDVWLQILDAQRVCRHLAGLGTTD